jgi:cytochrome b involved in lipid metabolism
LTDVAAHDDADSCWTSIEGRVYDMTDYIEDHPGGAAPILAVCGQDGTEIFMTMPAAVIPVARMGIAPYKIGTLAP